jgi:hypothetical protein
MSCLACQKGPTASCWFWCRQGKKKKGAASAEAPTEAAPRLRSAASFFRFFGPTGAAPSAALDAHGLADDEVRPAEQAHARHAVNRRMQGLRRCVS